MLIYLKIISIVKTKRVLSAQKCTEGTFYSKLTDSEAVSAVHTHAHREIENSLSEIREEEMFSDTEIPLP